MYQQIRETAASGLRHTPLSALDCYATRRGKAEPSGATRKLLAPLFARDGIETRNVHPPFSMNVLVSRLAVCAKSLELLVPSTAL